MSRRIGSAIAGKYRLLRHLGRDGDLERYLGEHTSIHRAVEVLCVAAGAPARGEAALQLLRTARTLGSATHRNLQSVVDSGLDGHGRPYLVLEALRGESLAERIRGAGPRRSVRHLRRDLTRVIRRPLRPRLV